MQILLVELSLQAKTIAVRTIKTLGLEGQFRAWLYWGNRRAPERSGLGKLVS